MSIKTSIHENVIIPDSTIEIPKKKKKKPERKFTPK